MRRTVKGTRRLVVAVFLLSVAACSGPETILEPKGPGAERVARLWWILFWIALVVFIIVLALMALSLRRRQRRGEDDTESNEEVPKWGHRFVLIAGFAIPVTILLSVFTFSLTDLNALNEMDSGGAPTSIEVVGHMWWWEARYPNGAVTANEMHIPVGEPVEFVLTTADVIHSFWIPALHPKRDMIPGRENTIVLQANEPGRYRGVCSEFCGLQHANMGLYVVADPDYSTWVTQQATDASRSSGPEPRGLDVFLSSTCVGCHTIRGTDADSDVGPDLTHLATRETLFAGIVENTREDLAKIVTDPQAVKPSVVMPPTALHPDDLDALLDYLESLQ